MIADDIPRHYVGIIYLLYRMIRHSSSIQVDSDIFYGPEQNYAIYRLIFIQGDLLSIMFTPIFPFKKYTFIIQTMTFRIFSK